MKEVLYKDISKNYKNWNLYFATVLLFDPILLLIYNLQVILLKNESISSNNHEHYDCGFVQVWILMVSE